MAKNQEKAEWVEPFRGPGSEHHGEGERRGVELRVAREQDPGVEVRHGRGGLGTPCQKAPSAVLMESQLALVQSTTISYQVSAPQKVIGFKNVGG